MSIINRLKLETDGRIDLDSSTYKIDTIKSTLKVGDLFQGGVIFYISGTTSGLITVQNPVCSWWVWGTGNVSTAIRSGLGNGKYNTEDIVNSHLTGSKYCGIAGEGAYNFVSEGYDDWWLPNITEVNTMLTNKDVCGINFMSTIWTSNQSTSDNRYAYPALLAGGGSYIGKSSQGSCFPVRKYTI